MNRAFGWLRLTAPIGFVALVVSSQAAGGRKQTFTGEIGDAMCGRKHMEGTAASCTRTCVSQGSRYVLITEDNIYPLKTSGSGVSEMLDKQAGKIANVIGILSGDTIEVQSVAAK